MQPQSPFSVLTSTSSMTLMQLPLCLTLLPTLFLLSRAPVAQLNAPLLLLKLQLYRPAPFPMYSGTAHCRMCAPFYGPPANFDTTR